MSEWSSILVPDETIIQEVINLQLGLEFVPFGAPMRNYPLTVLSSSFKDGSLILTNHRLIAQWKDQRTRLYSTLGVYALSERLFDPSRSNWPYQAIVILPGGISLVVETSNIDAPSANELSKFLNQVLLSLGKRETDIASLNAINAYLEELRRRDSNGPSQSPTSDSK